ncbi:hypothetical protein [Gimesia sp.]|uniref:hypothetical protein n=1 Tax=Gimesia sp. TaxID=2024833 RepID=UPI000C5C2CEB|nr:hypothetical protein [Gimesia sp.]MAX37065.1 hypothetical protein [Gimesia sp.]HAH44838.1 hypothetical protein [Planctomycetaceae bacterium]HBL43533.1 hypothetical protein [Planctomycetaceae bacterium]
MKKEEVAFIGCRLLGLFYIVKAIYAVSSFTLFFVSWKTNMITPTLPETSIIYYQLVPFLFYLFAGGLLWCGAEKIVNHLLPGTTIDNGLSSMTAMQVQSVIFSGVGILVLSLTVPEIGNVVFQMTQWENMSHLSQMPVQFKAQIFGLFCKLAVGLFLLFGSRGLSSLLVRLREAKLN